MTVKHENELGVYYDIPERVLNAKYKGCGNGQIVISKANGKIINMDYLDECDWVINEQNVFMHEDAGEVIDDRDDFIIYRANFSCCQACLF